MFSVRSPKNIKTEKPQKALISDLIINVKYRSFWVILIEIESAWSAKQALKLFLKSCDQLAASTASVCALLFAQSQMSLYSKRSIPVSEERCLANQRDVSLSLLFLKLIIT